MAPQREWFEKDYYKVLGVSETADQKEITRAYRKLARREPPRRQPGRRQAEERFKEISAAYDVVGDARSARSTTRSAGWVRLVRGSAAGGGSCRRLHVHR